MKHVLTHPSGATITFEDAAPLQLLPEANPVPMMRVTSPTRRWTVCTVLARLWWQHWLAEGFVA